MEPQPLMMCVFIQPITTDLMLKASLSVCSQGGSSMDLGNPSTEGPLCWPRTIWTSWVRFLPVNMSVVFCSQLK